jgi:hypothetical protein
MKKNIILIAIFYSTIVKGQELYVYSEPASNMPAHSLSAKISSNFIGKQQGNENRFMQRYTPELMFGINKKWMVHIWWHIRRYAYPQFQVGICLCIW